MGEQLKEADDRTILITIDGVEVEGWAGGNERNITVWIKKPFANMAHALHCPHFDPRLFVGEHRDKTARALLTDLYRGGRFLEQNRESLRAYYSWYCVNWIPGLCKSLLPLSVLSCEDNTFGEVGLYLNGKLHGFSRIRMACTIAFKVKIGFWRAELNRDFLEDVWPRGLTQPILSEYSIPRMLMGRRDLSSNKLKEM